MVPEEKKIRTLTGRSFILLIREFANYQSTALDKSKRMVDFLTESAKESLYSSELALRTEISEDLTMSRMNVINNETLLNMIARFLRPKTVEAYRKLIFMTVTAVKPKISGWQWGIPKYAEALHPVITILLREQEDIEELIRRGISQAQERVLPKVGWGSNRDPGNFQVHLECLGPYYPKFRAQLESQLKEKTTFSDYLKCVRDENNKMADLSNQILNMEAGFEPRSGERLSYTQMREKSYQDGLKLGLKTKKPLSAMAKEYRSRHSSLRLVGNEVVEVQDVGSEEESPDEGMNDFSNEDLVQVSMKDSEMSSPEDGLIAAMQAG